MPISSWFTAAVGLLISADGVLGVRLGASSYYQDANSCPERCIVSGPNTGNWSVYPNFKHVGSCQETMLFDFSLHDPVDDLSKNHYIQACTSFGPDFAKLAASSSSNTSSISSAEVEFQVGWWEEGYGMAKSGIHSLIKQMRHYADGGHGVTERPFIMYGRSGQATVGLYIGQGLLNEGISVSALKLFEDSVTSLNFSTPSLAMQLCGPNYDSTHVFGLMVISNATFNPIQKAIRT